MKDNTKAAANPTRTKITGPDGKVISLASLPLVAYSLTCEHLGRDYAVQKRDLIFCDKCGTTKRVKSIIAE